MQRESKLIANPFKMFLKHKGWYVENVHGNQYSSLPFDCVALHSQYEVKFIEFKVIEDNGSIHLSPNQQKKLPKWVMNGGKVWIIAGDDFRNEQGIAKMDRAYSKLFKPANCAYYLLPSNRRLYI